MFGTEGLAAERPFHPELIREDAWSFGVSLSWLVNLVQSLHV